MTDFEQEVLRRLCTIAFAKLKVEPGELLVAVCPDDWDAATISEVGEFFSWQLSDEMGQHVPFVAIGAGITFQTAILEQSDAFVNEVSKRVVRKITGGSDA